MREPSWSSFRIDTLVHFRGRIARRPLHSRPGRLRAHQRRRHACTAQGGEGPMGRSQAGTGASVPSCLDRRGLRLVVAEQTPRSTKSSSVRAEFSVFRQQSRAPITWCALITRPTDLQTTLTNCSNNYGPYQFPEKLIPLTLINILNGASAFPVYGDGLQVRDWLHVADHCEAIAQSRSTQGAARSRYTTSAATARPPTSMSCALLCAPGRRAARHATRNSSARLSRSHLRPERAVGARELIDPCSRSPWDTIDVTPIDYRKAQPRAWLRAHVRSCERGLRQTRWTWYLDPTAAGGRRSWAAITRRWLDANYEALRQRSPAQCSTAVHGTPAGSSQMLPSAGAERYDDDVMPTSGSKARL